MNQVYHIISSLDVGGAERVAISIAEGGIGQQHIVELFRGRGPYTEALTQELRQHGVHVHRAWLPLPFRWHYVCERLAACLLPLRLPMIVRKSDAIIHSHTEMPDLGVWLAFKLCPWLQARIVRTIHNTRLWSGMPAVARRIEPFFQACKANVAISPSVAECYAQTYGGTLPPVVYNGVEPVEQRPYDGLVAGKVNICFAARFEEQKGIATLCQIVRRAPADLHFHIFGSGRLQPMVDELATLPGATVRPPLPHAAAYLGAFDYVIMPSEHEGLPILAIEATLAGTPVLINRAPGLRDAMPPQWPLAVDGNDIDQWLALLSDLHPTPAPVEYARQHFSLQAMREGYRNVYNGLNT